MKSAWLLFTTLILPRTANGEPRTDRAQYSIALESRGPYGFAQLREEPDGRDVAEAQHAAPLSEHCIW